MDEVLMNAYTSDCENVSSCEEMSEMFQSFQHQFEDIVKWEESLCLDISSLKTGKNLPNKYASMWRKGPAPIEDKANIGVNKIGSLEVSRINFSAVQSFAESLPFDVISSTGFVDSMPNTTRNNMVINYFAYICTTDDMAEVDYAYLEMLFKIADINTVDKYGQSIMHEIAREWHTDVARYLKIRGVNIDIADNFGRTPLFVAVASNHTNMVRWLVQNGADINHRTIEGEGQHAIHFAAKHSAIEAFDVLVELGVSPIQRDDKGRTPFFLAAERGQHSMCDHLLELELPVASYAFNGVSTIDHVVSKLQSDSAYTALNQFIVTDLNGQEKYYLDCLNKRRWKLLTEFHHLSANGDYPTVLEIIVERNDMDLILHPIILKYIDIMSRKFGRKVDVNIFLCILFTVLWTVGILAYQSHDESHAIDHHVYSQLTLTALAQLLTFYFIFLLIQEYLLARRNCNSQREMRWNEIRNQASFIHPRWSDEKQFVKNEQRIVQRMSNEFWSDGWNYIEGVCLTMACIQTLLVIVVTIFHSQIFLIRVLQYYSISFSLVVWIRLNRCLRSHLVLGPFIAMLAECVTAVTRFAFLFFEFYIPFTCAFWVLFGGNRKGIVTEYTHFKDLVYQLFLMTIVGDYEYEPLKETDEITAQILLGLYFIVISIICLNLFIALLSEAFTRVSQKSTNRVYLRKAKDYVLLKRAFPALYLKFEKYLIEHGSPMKVAKIRGKSSKAIDSTRKVLRRISNKLGKLNCQMENIHSEQKKIEEFLMSGEESFRSFDIETNQLDGTNILNWLQSHHHSTDCLADKSLTRILLEKLQTLPDESLRSFREIMNGLSAEQTKDTSRTEEKEGESAVRFLGNGH